MARIREHLGTKKSSRQVIDKIMDLGLCDDRKKLKKSGGTRRRRGEGEMEKSASESDSGLATNSIFFCFLFVKKSLICLEGKSMTPHWGNAILFRSSQQLPRLRLGPSRGFLS